VGSRLNTDRCLQGGETMSTDAVNNANRKTLRGLHDIASNEFVAPKASPMLVRVGHRARPSLESTTTPTPPWATLPHRTERCSARSAAMNNAHREPPPAGHRCHTDQVTDMRNLSPLRRPPQVASNPPNPASVDHPTELLYSDNSRLCHQYT
jgi:hypothetical protein